MALSFLFQCFCCPCSIPEWFEGGGEWGGGAGGACILPGVSGAGHLCRLTWREGVHHWPTERCGIIFSGQGRAERGKRGIEREEIAAETHMQSESQESEVAKVAILPSFLFLSPAPLSSPSFPFSFLSHFLFSFLFPSSLFSPPLFPPPPLDLRTLRHGTSLLLVSWRRTFMRTLSLVTTSSCREQGHPFTLVREPQKDASFLTTGWKIMRYRLCSK